MHIFELVRATFKCPHLAAQVAHTFGSRVDQVLADASDNITEHENFKLNANTLALHGSNTPASAHRLHRNA